MNFGNFWSGINIESLLNISDHLDSAASLLSCQKSVKIFYQISMSLRLCCNIPNFYHFSASLVRPKMVKTFWQLSTSQWYRCNLKSCPYISTNFRCCCDFVNCDVTGTLNTSWALGSIFDVAATFPWSRKFVEILDQFSTYLRHGCNAES